MQTVHSMHATSFYKVAVDDDFLELTLLAIKHLDSNSKENVLYHVCAILNKKRGWVYCYTKKRANFSEVNSYSKFLQQSIIVFRLSRHVFISSMNSIIL